MAAAKTYGHLLGDPARDKNLIDWLATHQPRLAASRPGAVDAEARRA